MNNEDIIYAISKKTGNSFLDTRKTFDAILEVISLELQKKEKVKIKYFGSFEAVKRAPRKGFNPYYRKEVIIPECFEPVFKPCEELKNKVKEIPD